MANNKSYFWTSYSDLMTTLFFVMLMLFVVAIVELNIEKDKADEGRVAAEEQLNKIQEIENATKNINKDYFTYEDKYKKHKLTIDVQFPTNSSDISKISQETLNQLAQAGHSIQTFINEVVRLHPEIQYILIIEGQASKDTYNRNYELSYERALALKKFWESRNIIFDQNKSEVLICGSGDGTQSGTALMREKGDEKLNQRFLIHIIPKPGIIKKLNK